jgi:hypothetical protein
MRGWSVWRFGGDDEMEEGWRDAGWEVGGLD